MTRSDLRRHAVARSLFSASDLQSAIDAFGFVQADPIQAPARAQDLTLRHRVAGYRAGELGRRYADLQVEEDVFVNYGFVTPAVHALMHPRASSPRWPAARRRRAEAILEFVRERGTAHPRDVQAHFDHGRARNYWGGSSNATTLLLEAMHYRGMLRVVRRDQGVRVYAVRDSAALGRIAGVPAGEVDARLDALADLAVAKYAPLPGPTLSMLVRRLRYAVPQWTARIPPALTRIRARLAHARIDGVDWYWPAGDDPSRAQCRDEVRLLAPFDPIVWDRRRFELLWEWEYRFEAYTPEPKRRFGYYALPLLWRDQVPGWANVSLADDGALDVRVGYVAGRPPRARAFARELGLELDRLRTFLGATRHVADRTEQGATGA